GVAVGLSRRTELGRRCLGFLGRRFVGGRGGLASSLGHECLSIDACEGAKRAPDPAVAAGTNMPSPTCIRRNDAKPARYPHPMDGNRRESRTLIIENYAFYCTWVEESSLPRFQPGQTLRQGLVTLLVGHGLQPPRDELVTLILYRHPFDLAQGIVPFRLG